MHKYISISWYSAWWLQLAKRININWWQWPIPIWCLNLFTMNFVVHKKNFLGYVRAERLLSCQWFKKLSLLSPFSLSFTQMIFNVKGYKNMFWCISFDILCGRHSCHSYLNLASLGGEWICHLTCYSVSISTVIALRLSVWDSAAA